MYSNNFFKQFCNDRNIKKSTVDGYSVALNQYVDFQGMSINNLLKEAFNDEEKRIPLKDRKLKKRLLDFRNHLLNSSLSSNSAKTYFSKVKTFYMHFEIEIPYLPTIQFDNDYETNYYDLPTRKHIRDALESVSVDLKAVILFMSSSGTAKAETLSLTVRDFIEASNEYHNGGSIKKVLDVLDGRDDVVPTFYLKRIKTDKYYYTFCSPEASQMIVKYLKTRPNLKNNDFLFDFTDATLINRFRQINDSNGWGCKGKYRFFRTHTLRKFHASNIGLSAEYIDALQGRSKNPIEEKDKEVVKQEFNIIINVFLSGKEYNII